MPSITETLAVMTRRPVPVPPTAAEIGAGVLRLIAARAATRSLVEHLAREQAVVHVLDTIKGPQMRPLPLPAVSVPVAGGALAHLLAATSQASLAYTEQLAGARAVGEFLRAVGRGASRPRYPGPLSPLNPLSPISHTRSL